MSDPTVNRRILVVDDQQSVHDAIGRCLAGSGLAGDTSSLDAAEADLFGSPTSASDDDVTFEIDSALQGEEALERVQAAIAEDRPYAMAFVDMRMPPGWDGVETIERIWEADPSLQIVVCTAYSDQPWNEIVARLGRTDRLLLVKKPFDDAEVWQAAAAMTEKRHLTESSQTSVVALEEANRRLEEEVARRLDAEASLRETALQDPLTRLANRQQLLDRISHCIERSRRASSHRFALLFLDLDNFKIINDSLGHDIGDRVLLEVADRLVTTIRTLDLPARVDNCEAGRLGGDEFAIVIEDIHSVSDALIVAERVHAAVAERFQLDGREVSLTASIGIAEGHSEYERAEDLVRDADTAMYRAKLSGKSQWCVFDAAMHKAVTARLHIEGELRWAIEREQLHLDFQPIVHLHDRSIHGFEALLRWTHPDLGRVAPIDFIPIAEESNLIVPIGEWVLERACEQLARWNRPLPGNGPVLLNVNISKRQFVGQEFPGRVLEVLQRHDIDPAWLKLEVTESAIGESPESVINVLHELKRHGIELSMDDFGTGHSSLSCLHRFPIDNLKIDRAFADTLGSHHDYAAVVRAIVDLAHNFGATVTAEGVETEAQAALLEALGCDLGQGYLFARPMSGAETVALLDTDRQRRDAA